MKKKNRAVPCRSFSSKQFSQSVEKATGLPDVWFDRFRRELSSDGDSRSIQALLAIRSVAHAIETKLTDWLVPDGITIGQFNVMISLWGADDYARSMSDVSRALVTSAANATKIVSQLEAEGLVERASSDHDKRSIIARLTPNGAKLMASVAPGQVARVEAAMDTVPGWVCEALIEYLGHVREGFQSAPSRSPDMPSLKPKSRFKVRK